LRSTQPSILLELVNAVLACMAGVKVKTVKRAVLLWGVGGVLISLSVAIQPVGG